MNHELSEKQKQLLLEAKIADEIFKKHGIPFEDETEEHEGSGSLMFLTEPKRDLPRNPGEVLEENLSRFPKGKTVRESIAEEIAKDHPGLTAEEALEMMAAFGF